MPPTSARRPRTARCIESSSARGSPEPVGITSRERSPSASAPPTSAACAIGSLIDRAISRAITTDATANTAMTARIALRCCAASANASSMCIVTPSPHRRLGTYVHAPITGWPSVSVQYPLDALPAEAARSLAISATDCPSARPVARGPSPRPGVVMMTLPPMSAAPVTSPVDPSPV